MTGFSPGFTFVPAFPAAMLLTALLENVPDAVYFKDRECRFIAVSRSTAAKHGLAVSDMLGKTDFDLFPREFAQRAYDDEQRIMRTGEPIVAQLEREPWPDGRVTWSLNHKLVVRNAAGESIGTFGLGRDVTQAKEMEIALEKAQRDLVHASHLAGMAEVATNVLHNVGNVLNSVNVSATLIAERLERAGGDSLARLATLIRQHQGDLARFLQDDPKGQLLPQLLDAMASERREEQARLIEEIQLLRSNLDHIKDIVATQQAYATTAGVVEDLDAGALMEDALRMNSGSLMRHQIRVERRFEAVPKVVGQRSKILQILVNLIQNAQEACDAMGGGGKAITLRIESAPPGRVALSVHDNGAGIVPENLQRIFTHGFTTKRTGHGFGLHSAANAAREMGGSLTVGSAGAGGGAGFTLHLPAAKA